MDHLDCLSARRQLCRSMLVCMSLSFQGLITFSNHHLQTLSFQGHLCKLLLQLTPSSQPQLNSTQDLLRPSTSRLSLSSAQLLSSPNSPQLHKTSFLKISRRWSACINKPFSRSLTSELSTLKMPWRCKRTSWESVGRWCSPSSLSMHSKINSPSQISSDLVLKTSLKTCNSSTLSKRH